MYANFTQETCTGTGSVLTLTGATDGMLPFSASFTDGDEVAYTVIAGDTLVRGVGTYNQGQITRNDTWSSVAGVVSNAPLSNAPLGTGSHLVQCNVGAETAPNLPMTGLNRIIFSAHTGMNTGVDSGPIDADYVYYLPFKAERAIPFKQIVFRVREASTDVNGRAIVGLVTASKTGQPIKVLAQTGEVDVSVSGEQFITASGVVPAGWSYFVVLSNTSFNMGAATRDNNQPSILMGALNTGAVLRGRVYVRISAPYASTLPDPLPPIDGKGVDLGNLPSVGVVHND